MKKLASLLLALGLCLALCANAFAADDVRLSPQKLRVDGAEIACEKYNINGANYFKLRDLAMLLRGTGSQFTVGFADGVVSITTGLPYAPEGGELGNITDKSASAQPSKQTIRIDGATRSDLTAYNIGGANFFQLRELGAALGFSVDFESATNTAVVTSASGAAQGTVTGYAVARVTVTENGETKTYELPYKVTGYTISSEIPPEVADNGEGVSLTYDAAGRLIERVMIDGGSRASTTIVRDTKGRIIRETVNATSTLRSVNEYAYNNDDTIATQTLFSYYDGNLEYSQHISFQYDAYGHVARITVSGGNDEVSIDGVYHSESNSVVFSANDGAIEYFYDGQNRLVRIVQPMVTTEYQYAADGALERRAVTTYYSGNEPFGKFVQVIDGHDNILSGFFYNKDGSVQSGVEFTYTPVPLGG